MAHDPTSKTAPSTPLRALQEANDKLARVGAAARKVCDAARSLPGYVEAGTLRSAVLELEQHLGVPVEPPEPPPQPPPKAAPQG